MLCLVRYLFVISTSVIDCLGRFVPEMTYYVSSGTLNLAQLNSTQLNSTQLNAILTLWSGNMATNRVSEYSLMSNLVDTTLMLFNKGLFRGN